MCTPLITPLAASLTAPLTWLDPHALAQDSASAQSSADWLVNDRSYARAPLANHLPGWASRPYASAALRLKSPIRPVSSKSARIVVYSTSGKPNDTQPAANGR
jgi:hypothetical protein